MAELFKGLEVPNIQDKLEEGVLKENLGSLSTFLNDLLLKSQKVSFVGQYGDETIYGVKTFDEIPVLPDSDPTTDNQAVRKKYLSDQLGGMVLTLASQAEAEAGSDNEKYMSPLRVAQAISALTVSFPSGGIIMWSGTIATIPTGWYLCNGSNGTPDLRDKFVIGAKQDDSGTPKTNVTGSLTQTGGEAAHTLTIEEMPAHTHTSAVHVSNNRFNAGLPGHAEAGNTGSTGGGLAHNNLPPYYALAYIMKG